MINFNNVTKENIKEHNPNWPQILDHLFRILIISVSEYGKANLLFSLIIQQLDIEKFIYMLKTHMKQNINF